MKVEVRWIGKLVFIGENEKGKTIVMDSSVEPWTSNAAPSPMEVLLMSLGACTGMDVVSVLKKMRQNVEEFKVVVEGKRREEHPKVYTEIKIRYIAKGDIDEKKLEKAIKLSYDKYCPIVNMFKPVAKVSYEYEIQR